MTYEYLRSLGILTAFICAAITVSNWLRVPVERQELQTRVVHTIMIDPEGGQ